MRETWKLSCIPKNEKESKTSLSNTSSYSYCAHRILALVDVLFLSKGLSTFLSTTVLTVTKPARKFGDAMHTILNTTLFISLEIDRFHCYEDKNICKCMTKLASRHRC